MQAILLNQVQHDFREVMRSFCDHKIAPHAAHVDKTGEYPGDNFKACAEMELPGLSVLAAYGGAGAGNVTQATMVEELARVGGSSSLMLAINGLTSRESDG